MENKQKYLEYAAVLTGKIAELFDNDDENGIKINQQELLEGDNLTHFFHALANAMPTHFYNQITGDDKNSLEFNHIANQLIFQYNQLKDK